MVEVRILEEEPMYDEKIGRFSFPTIISYYYNDQMFYTIRIWSWKIMCFRYLYENENLDLVWNFKKPDYIGCPDYETAVSVLINYIKKYDSFHDPVKNKIKVRGRINWYEIKPFI